MHSLAAAGTKAINLHALAGTPLLAFSTASRTCVAALPVPLTRQDPPLAGLKDHARPSNTQQADSTQAPPLARTRPLSACSSPCLPAVSRLRLAFAAPGERKSSSHFATRLPLDTSSNLQEHNLCTLRSFAAPLVYHAADPVRARTCRRNPSAISTLFGVDARNREAAPSAAHSHSTACAAAAWGSSAGSRCISGYGSRSGKFLGRSRQGEGAGKVVADSGAGRGVVGGGARSISGYGSRQGKLVGRSGEGEGAGRMPGAEMGEMDIQELARLMQMQASKLAEQAMSMSTVGHRAAADASSQGLTSSPETSKMTIFNHPLPTGVEIPRLGLGVFMASPQEAEESIQFALAEGYRHIDTARLYKNEAAVGRAVKSSGIPREEIFVTTKLWNSDHGYQNTLTAFQKSLSDLGLDYVDLFLIHSPLRMDSRLETWRAMEEILRSGKAKAVGVSNYGIHHLEELMATCTFTPAVNQIELHPFCTREKLVAFCREHGIALQAYSPLTKGKRLKDPTLLEIAGRYKKSTAQLLIRWGLQKDYIVLPKSVTPSRIAANAQVFNFEISPEDMAAMDALNENFVTGWDPTRSS